MTFDPRHKSRTLLEGPDRAPARPMLEAIGFTDEDLARLLVGVAHCWMEVTPCNFNHRKLAEKVKEGVRAAGGMPIEFNTITVTDGIAMGTEGMKASLISRENVADTVELVSLWADSPLLLTPARGLPILQASQALPCWIVPTPTEQANRLGP